MGGNGGRALFKAITRRPPQETFINFFHPKPFVGGFF